MAAGNGPPSSWNLSVRKSLQGARQALLSRLSKQMESEVTLGRLENGSRKCSYRAVLMNDWLHRNPELD